MLKNVRLKPLAALFGVAIAVIAIALYCVDLSTYDSFSYFMYSPPGGDYYNFWAAGRMAWFHPEGAYQAPSMTAMLSTIMKIKTNVYGTPIYYPPTYLLFLAPFGLLEYFVAHLVFFLCGLALFLSTLWVITRQRWFVIFMLCFTGIWINLVSGQNGLYTASLAGLGFVLLGRNPVVAGLCFGLLTMKPHLGLLIPVALVAARAWKAIGTAVLVALALFMLAGVIFGPDIWVWGLSGMANASYNLSQAQSLWIRIPSAFSTMRLSGVTPGLAMLLQLILIIPMSMIVWGVWRHSRNQNLNAVVSCCAALLVTPFVYDYDMALLGIALAFLAVEISRNGWWWGERLVLPLIIIWPVAVNKISSGLTLQLGLLGPLFLMFLAIRRILKELKVAPQPVPALNTSV